MLFFHKSNCSYVNVNKDGLNIKMTEKFASFGGYFLVLLDIIKVTLFHTIVLIRFNTLICLLVHELLFALSFSSII